MKHKQKLPKKSAYPSKTSFYILIGGAFLFVAAVLIIKAVSFFGEVKHEKIEAGAYIPGEIPAELVCMVNDNYMGTAQIPVEVEGETYYGCCKMCVSKLQTNQDGVRYAIDPFSNESVDKAKAFIIMKPGSNKEVYYFKSKNNADRYLKQRKK